MLGFCSAVCFCPQGLDDESQERGTLLGSYSYDQDGEALQTFSVAVSKDCRVLVYALMTVSSCFTSK